MASDDIELGFDDDDLDFGAPDFGDGIDSPQEGDRNPASAVVKSTLSTIQRDLADPSTIGTVLKNNLPSDYKVIASGVEDLDGIRRDISKEAKKQLSGPTNELKRALSNALPEKIANKLEGILKTKDQSGYEVNPQQAQMQLELDAIFGAQQQQEAANQEVNLAQSTSQEINEESRHKESQASLDSTQKLMQRLVSYQDTITAQYQRKDLELAYRRTYAIENLLKIQSTANEAQIESLAKVIQNTGLPEIRKQELTEGFQEQMREKLVGTGIETAEEWSSGFKQRLKDGVMNKAREKIEGIGEAMGGITELLSTMGSDDGEGMSPLDLASSMAGGKAADLLKDKVGGPLAIKLFKELEKNESFRKFGSDGAAMFSNPAEMLNTYLKDNSDVEEDDGTLVKLIKKNRDVLSDIVGVREGNQEKIQQNLLDTAIDPVPFDVLTRRSIIEIIPGYLSRILHETQMQRTGEETSRLIYNKDREEFTTLKDAQQDASKKIFDQKAHQELGRASINSTTSLLQKNDIVLSTEAKLALANKMMELTLAGEVFLPQKLMTEDSYLGPTVPMPLVDEIRDALGKAYGLGEDGKGGKANKLIVDSNKARKGISAAQVDYQTHLTRYSGMGDREILDGLDILKVDEDGKSSVDHDKLYRKNAMAMRSAQVSETMEANLDEDRKVHSPVVDVSNFDASRNTVYGGPEINQGDKFRITDTIASNNIQSGYDGFKEDSSLLSKIDSIARKMDLSIDSSNLTAGTFESSAKGDHGFAADGYIGVKDGLSGNMLDKTLAHELKHIEQIQSGRLQVEEDHYVWEGNRYPKSLPYGEHPWESEPKDIAKDLSEEINNTISKAAPVMTNDTFTASNDENWLTTIDILRDIRSNTSEERLSSKIDGLGQILSTNFSLSLNAEKLASLQANPGIFGRMKGAAADGINSVLGAMKGGMGRAWNFGTGMLGSGFDVFSGGVDLAKGLASWTWDKATDKAEDIYMTGRDEPVMLARDIRQGRYRDAETGDVIKTADDITGDVVLVKGGKQETVITEEEFRDNKFFNAKGESLLRKAGSFMVDSASTFLGGMYGGFSGAIETLKDVGKATVQWGAEQRRRFTDIYVRGEDSPRLLAAKMRKGHYIKEDNTVISSFEDIDGDVYDRNGDVILSADELKDPGLMDKNGNELKVRSVTETIVDLALNGGKKVWGLGKAALGKLGAMKDSLFGAATGMFGGVFDFFFGGNKVKKIGKFDHLVVEGGTVEVVEKSSTGIAEELMARSEGKSIANRVGDKLSGVKDWILRKKDEGPTLDQIKSSIPDKDKLEDKANAAVESIRAKSDIVGDKIKSLKGEAMERSATAKDYLANKADDLYSTAYVATDDAIKSVKEKATPYVDQIKQNMEATKSYAMQQFDSKIGKYRSTESLLGDLLYVVNERFGPNADYVMGDTDGDGTTENSLADIRAKRKSKSSETSKSTTSKPTGKVAGFGKIGAALAAMGAKMEDIADNTDEGGFLENTAEEVAGEAIADKVTGGDGDKKSKKSKKPSTKKRSIFGKLKAGAKGLWANKGKVLSWGSKAATVGTLAGGATTAAAGTGIGATVAGVGGSILAGLGAILTSPVTLGVAAVVGAGALIYGGYRLYKGMTRVKPYDHLRPAWLGLNVNDKEQMSPYFELEDELWSKTSSGNISVKPQEVLKYGVELFGVNPDDINSVRSFTEWFDRFRVQLVTYKKALLEMDHKGHIADFDDLKDADKIKVLKSVNSKLPKLSSFGTLSQASDNYPFVTTETSYSNLFASTISTLEGKKDSKVKGVAQTATVAAAMNTTYGNRPSVNTELSTVNKIAESNALKTLGQTANSIKVREEAEVRAVLESSNVPTVGLNSRLAIAEVVAREDKSTIAQLWKRVRMSLYDIDHLDVAKVNAMVELEQLALNGDIDLETWLDKHSATFDIDSSNRSKYDQWVKNRVLHVMSVISKVFGKNTLTSPPILRTRLDLEDRIVKLYDSCRVGRATVFAYELPMGSKYTYDIRSMRAEIGQLVTVWGSKLKSGVLLEDTKLEVEAEKIKRESNKPVDVERAMVERRTENKTPVIDNLTDVKAGRAAKPVRVKTPDAPKKIAGNMKGEFIRPVSDEVNSLWGMRVHPLTGESKMHNGIDFRSPTGTPVYASLEGTITRRWTSKSYGKVIYIEHPDGKTSRYAHLSSFEPGLSVGDEVTQGQLIGYVGSTGRSSGPHLHFEIRKNDEAFGPSLDPISMFGPSDAKEAKKFSDDAEQLAKVEDKESGGFSAEGLDTVTAVDVAARSKERDEVSSTTTTPTAINVPVSAAPKPNQVERAMVETANAQIATQQRTVAAQAAKASDEGTAILREQLVVQQQMLTGINNVNDSIKELGTSIERSDGDSKPSMQTASNTSRSTPATGSAMRSKKKAPIPMV